MNRKLPSFQFYPGDWLKNANLRLCSKAEKGMWIDLICLAFECEERGKFMTNGIPWTLRNISDALPGGSKMNLKLIQNLVKKDVLKVDERGMFYCSRIVRDEEIRKVRSHSGELGGNPHFKKGNPNPYYPQKDNQKDNQKISKQDNQKITPSSSSSSSRLKDKEKKRDKDSAESANDAAPPSSVNSSPKVVQEGGRVLLEVVPASPPKDLVVGIVKPKPPHVEFVEKFGETYAAMTHEPFSDPQRCYVLASKMIGKHGLDAVVKKARTLGRLCDRRSVWFTKDGWADFTIEKLSNRWNEILEGSEFSEEEKMRIALKKAEENNARLNSAMGRN